MHDIQATTIWAEEADSALAVICRHIDPSLFADEEETRGQLEAELLCYIAMQKGAEQKLMAEKLVNILWQSQISVNSLALKADYWGSPNMRATRQHEAGSTSEAFGTLTTILHNATNANQHFVPDMLIKKANHQLLTAVVDDCLSNSTHQGADFYFNLSKTFREWLPEKLARHLVATAILRQISAQEPDLMTILKTHGVGSNVTNMVSFALNAANDCEDNLDQLQLTPATLTTQKETTKALITKALAVSILMLRNDPTAGISHEMCQVGMVKSFYDQAMCA